MHVNTMFFQAYNIVHIMIHVLLCIMYTLREGTLYMYMHTLYMQYLACLKVDGRGWISQLNSHNTGLHFRRKMKVDLSDLHMYVKYKKGVKKVSI